MNYIIYCRKSTDETSEHQKQSIADQIKVCMEYAKREGMEIMKKPKNFEVFESEIELQKEDNESDLEQRRLFQETRELFIVKEQKTAKIPYARKKWRKIIEWIQKGKIRGILSYSPDRQARNLLEGGELIDLVDQKSVELRYTNFHFEDNASGKMMLGIWFVFSKQYSDKLSEDISRGNKNMIASGKAIGKVKHGYTINEEGYHEIDQKYGPMIRKAFEMKLDGKTDKEIKKYLNNAGYERTTKRGNILKMSEKNLYKMWVDEFYYGIYNNRPQRGESIL